MMAPDYLHQVLKGLLSEHLEGWITSVIEHDLQAGTLQIDTFPRADGKGQAFKSRAEALISTRFAQVERFGDMITWKSWASTHQWTGKMYKSMVRQIVPVLAPLLKQNRAAMLFVRAFVDFAILSRYTSHDANTIEYLEAALYRMDRSKDAFLAFRPDGRSAPHFNIPKLHAVTHYPHFIRQFGSLRQTDTESPEHAHIEQKAFYAMSNKRSGYDNQILRYNTIYGNLNIRQELELHDATIARPLVDNLDNVQATRLSKYVNVASNRSYKWGDIYDISRSLQHRRINTHIWRAAGEVEERTGISTLVSCLAAFVRECRKRIDGARRSDRDIDRLETDEGWVSAMPVAIHHSLTCYVQLGKETQDENEPQRILARCTPLWSDTEGPRHDCVLVREFERATDVLRGHKVGRLQLLISVQDTERTGADGRYEVYAGALIETFHTASGGSINDTTGLLRVQAKQQSTAKKKRKLGAVRIYDINHITRPVCLIPTDLNTKDSFYVNNYTDWDIYNMIYDDDFIKKNKAAVDALDFSVATTDH